MTVAAILKHKGGDVITVAPSASLPEMAEIIASRRIGAVVVMAEESRLAGIVSERDIVKAIANEGARALELTASDIMTREVTTAKPATTIDEAMEMMDNGYFRHLPVVENGTLVGIISVRDVVRAHIQDQAHVVDSLRSYVFRGAQVDGLR